MKPEHLQQLAAIFDDLMEVAIVELNPRSWPGYGVKPMDMTKEERGDRVWCKKDAASTLTLITKIDHLQTGYTPDSETEELETLIANAQREAQRLVAKVMG